MMMPAGTPPLARHRHRRPSSRRAHTALASADSETSVVAAPSDSPSPNGPHIVWLRAGDLRTHDHPGLAAAAEAERSSSVVPVFVFDRSESQLCTPATLRVLHESVVELRATLRDMGSDLVVRVGDPVVELPALAKAVGATSATMQRELEWARRGTQRATVDALRAAGVTCDEWSAELREPTEASIEAAAVAAAEARAVKSAPLCAFASETAYVASRGAVASPLPSPEFLPSLPPTVTEKKEEKQRGGDDDASFIGDIPSVVGHRSSESLNYRTDSQTHTVQDRR